jgi:NitT/TauT family transport system permease protein
MKTYACRLLLPVLTGLLLTALWYGIRGSMSPERQYLLPPPHAVLEAFVEKRATFFEAALNTAGGAAIGFLAAVAISTGAALILALSPLVRAGFYPYLMILQMTPVIVFAPILILFVGPGIKSVSVITFLICFFPLVVNTTQGLVSADKNLVDLFRMCKATRRDEILLLRMPAALPYFFTGMRIAATLAPIGAIVGDYTAGNSAGGVGGLGFLIIIHSSRFELAELYATAFCSCLLGFIFVSAVLGLNWLMLHKWHDSFSRTDN